MVKFKALTLFLIVFCIHSFSQIKYTTTNYFGVETFSLFINRSDDSENLKDILMGESEIKSQIAFKTGLRDNNPTSQEEIFNNITIFITYNIYKNPYAEEQYFGNYELKVLRVLNIPNSNYITNPHAIIYITSTSFVNTYPIKDAWKKEIKEYLTTLINEFALDFKSSY